MDRLEYMFVFVIFLGLRKVSGLGDGSGVRCFDCNYDPSSYVVTSYGSYETRGERGFPRCSLDGVNDEVFVDRWPCYSGTCFIRKDADGLVYRGCADSWNLPWKVDVEVSCRPQGQKPSTWWFCKGDRCNTGTFGVDVCSEMSTNQSTGLMETVHGESPSADYLGPTGGDNAATDYSGPTGGDRPATDYSGPTRDYSGPTGGDRPATQGVMNGQDFRARYEHGPMADADFIQAEGSKSHGSSPYGGYYNYELPVWEAFTYHHPSYSWMDYGQGNANMNGYHSAYYPSKSYRSSGEQPGKPDKDDLSPKHAMATTNGGAPKETQLQESSYGLADDKSIEYQMFDEESSDHSDPGVMWSEPPTNFRQSNTNGGSKMDPAGGQRSSGVKTWDAGYLPNTDLPVVGPADYPEQPPFESKPEEPQNIEKAGLSYQMSNKRRQPTTMDHSKSLKSYKQPYMSHRQPTKSYKSYQQPNDDTNHNGKTENAEPNRMVAQEHYQYRQEDKDRRYSKFKSSQKSPKSISRSQSNSGKGEKRPKYSGQQPNYDVQPPTPFKKPSTTNEKPPVSNQQPTQHQSYVVERPSSKSAKHQSKSYQSGHNPNQQSDQPSESPTKTYQPEHKPIQQSDQPSEPPTKTYQPEHKPIQQSDQPSEPPTKTYQPQPHLYYYNQQTKYHQPHQSLPKPSIYGQPASGKDAPLRRSEHYPTPPPGGPSVEVTTPSEEYIYGSEDSYREDSKSGQPKASNEAKGGGMAGYDWTSIYKSLGWDDGSPSVQRLMMANKKPSEEPLPESGLVAAVPENPCDYRCQGNPSGLFEHPRGGSWFIQCGDSMEEGEACRCCKPYFLRCPNGTAFDPRTRVCSEHTSSSDHKHYTVID